MKELREFIKVLLEMGYEMVSIGEVFEEENAKLISLKDVKNEIKKLGIDEIVAEYDVSFEFVTRDGKYIEVSGVC